MAAYIVTGILALAAAVPVFRVYQYKRQIRNFTKAVEGKKDGDRNGPVTVDCFDCGMFKCLYGHAERTGGTL